MLIRSPWYRREGPSLHVRRGVVFHKSWLADRNPLHDRATKTLQREPSRVPARGEASVEKRRTFSLKAVGVDRLKLLLIAAVSRDVNDPASGQDTRQLSSK